MTTIANRTLILDELAKKAGYMILSEDSGYVRYWVRENGDIVKPHDQEPEIYELVKKWAQELAPQDRDHIMSMSGMARIESFWGLRKD